MAGVGYEVKIGSLVASSVPRQGDIYLVSLVSELDMDGVGGRCSMRFAGRVPGPPGYGEEVQCQLDGGYGLVTVFTGEVDRVEKSHASVSVVATDGLSRLARLNAEATYEEVDAGFIVDDLISQAGLQAGTVDNGPSFPAYFLRQEPRALAHLRRLASLCGADLFTDSQGAVHFTGPQTAGAQHTFRYAENILSIDLWDASPAYDSAVLWGEGAASTQGSDKWYWLVTDLAGVSGKARLDASGTVTGGSAGDRPLVALDGAVRSGEDAGSLAEARSRQIASRRVRGNLEVLGAPSVQPGDLVSIEGLPRDDWEAKAQELASNALRVRRVRHTLDLRKGFFTLLEF